MYNFDEPRKFNSLKKKTFYLLFIFKIECK